MSSYAEELATYLQSMPAAYRATFDADAARAHEAIVRRRGNRAVHVEIWRTLSDRVVGICVVADDKAGLLSCISAALVANRVDVVGADAYCRTRPDGVIEAVDLLWLRRLPSADDPRRLVAPIRSRHIAVLADAIERAIVNDDRGSNLDLEEAPPSSSELVRPATAEIPAARGVSGAHLADGSSARIRFDTTEGGRATMLTVEAVDRPGLLLAVTQALFRAGLQIIALRATTEPSADGRLASAVDRFTLVEADGTPLRQSRLLALQPALLEALDEGALAPRRRSTGSD